MKISKYLIITVTTFSLLSTAPIFAADSPFQSGVKAFKEGDFSTACKQFDRAYTNGLRKSSLLYNLGVCNYKLKQYTSAKKWFSQLTEDNSLSQIAHYNLGLISQKEGKNSTAVSQFKLAQSGNNDTITTLSSQQLKDIKRPAKKARTEGFTMVNLAFGYDDNIIDPAATTASNAGDNFISIFVVASRYLSDNHKNGWRIKGSIYRTDYFSVNAYDMLNIKGGITRAINAKEWSSKLSLDYSQITLNGANYLSKTSFTAKSKNNTLSNGSLEIRYRLSRINATNPAYDHLAGNQQQFRIEQKWRGAKQKQLRIGYAFEQNSRNDLYTGPILTTSYSPTRHTFNLRGNSELNAEWLGKAHLSYRISQYPADSSPKTRRDLTTTIGFSAERTVWSQWDFSAGLKHTNNNSNINTNSYSRNEYTLQLTRAF